MDRTLITIRQRVIKNVFYTGAEPAGSENLPVVSRRFDRNQPPPGSLLQPGRRRFGGGRFMSVRSAGYHGLHGRLRTGYDGRRLVGVAADQSVQTGDAAGAASLGVPVRSASLTVLGGAVDPQQDFRSAAATTAQTRTEQSPRSLLISGERSGVFSRARFPTMTRTAAIPRRLANEFLD